MSTIKNPVIVMALYDIGRDNWSNFTVSYNTYLYWMKNTLALDANIVIYTENKFIETIKQYRQEFDLNFKKTIIVEQPLEDLDCYKLYYNKLSNLMSSNIFKEKIHHDVPEMTKPLYNIIMFNKLYFLQHAKNNNFFNSDLFIWADAGGLRDDLSLYQDKIWPSLEKINKLDNNKITFFTHSKNIRIDHNEFHAMSQMRYIQGTCFFVPGPMIDKLIEECNETIDDSINNNYIGSDEKIFDITYLKNPNKYNLIECTWRKYFDIFKDGSSPTRAFLDLGAYECETIKQKIVELNIDDSWEIHAFEPNIKIDTNKYAENNKTYNITIHRSAVWCRNGLTVLNRYGEGGLGQGSLLEETEAGRWYSDYFDSCIVNCIDLHKFILDLNKEVYLSIDIEHSEYILLEYMFKNSWPKNIKKIWIEWHDTNNPIKKQQAIDLENKIRNKGTLIESRMV